MDVDAQRIVVRAPNWVGDVVMATPTFRALRETFPQAHLAVVLRPYVEPIVRGAPWFDEVIATDDRRLGDFLELTRRLRAGSFDLAVILPNSVRSALEAWLGRARRRLGYDRRYRGILLTDPVAPPHDSRGRFVPRNMVDYYLTLCQLLGCQHLSRREELFITPECGERGEALLAKHQVGTDQTLFAVNPGGAFGGSKLWLPDRFATVADTLADRHGARIVLFGSPKERPILETVAQAMTHEPILFEPGELDLDVLKPLMRRCSLLVTNDTGARHYGVAFDVPVVCIMGSTSPLYTDVNLERQTVVRVDVDCGPCQKKVCTTDHRCMTLITPEMVLDAAEGLLAGRRGMLPR